MHFIDDLIMTKLHTFASYALMCGLVMRSAQESRRLSSLNFVIKSHHTLCYYAKSVLSRFSLSSAFKIHPEHHSLFFLVGT